MNELLGMKKPKTHYFIGGQIEFLRKGHAIYYIVREKIGNKLVSKYGGTIQNQGDLDALLSVKTMDDCRKFENMVYGE